MSPGGGADLRRLVLPEDAGGRLDSVLSRLLPGVSRRRLKAALKAGCVRLDGRPARGAEPARPGALVEIEDLPDAGAAVPGVPLPTLEIVHADEALLVVEKPAGVPALPLAPGEGGTVAEAVLAAHPEVAGVGDLPAAPGLCHRLDVETSGLLLFARTEAAFASVRGQFREGAVEKVYLAIVDGRLTGEGVIDVAIGRRSARRMVAEPPPGMRSWPARTRWEAVAHGSERTRVSIVLETGVTHQARVHMAWLGHPILGDDRYGGPPAPRLALHADVLGLCHPTTGRAVRWQSARGETVAAMLA